MNAEGSFSEMNGVDSLFLDDRVPVFGKGEGNLSLSVADRAANEDRGRMSDQGCYLSTFFPCWGRMDLFGRPFPVGPGLYGVGEHIQDGTENFHGLNLEQ